MSGKPQPVAFNPVKGHRPTPANCRVDELQIDPTYQREMGQESNNLVRAIARDWDWSLCQPLIVARRLDDSLFVVDGQHRLCAARMRGDIHDLPAVIIHFGGAGGEAQAFVSLNTARRPLSAFAIWKAAMAAGDVQAIALRDLLAHHNLQATGNANRVTWKAGTLGGIYGLRRILDRHGVAHLDRVLEALVGAFGDEPLSHAPILIAAISALFLQTDITTDVMTRVLRGKNQDMWARAFNARMATTGDGYQVAAIAALRSAALSAPAFIGGYPPHQQPPASSPTSAAAKPKLTFEQQLDRVRSGEATISEKPRMPSAVPQTHVDSSLA